MIRMQRPPALAIVSFHSCAGKTTLLEGIIRFLTKMGYRVCAIKHSAHDEIHDSGKDTWKYREAGATSSTLLQSNGHLEFCTQSANLQLAIDLTLHFKPDIVLCEGFKNSDLPKIAVVDSSELRLGMQLQGVVALVLNAAIAPVSGVTCLPFDPSAVAAFIESRFLAPRQKVNLTDRYGRRILGIRMSLTQRCNLNCVYCHHEGEGPPSGEMYTDEVLRILRVARDLGIRRVKFTGGEPLLRKDLGGIVAYSYALGLKDVSVTTNGQLLRERALELYEAGLRRLNLSLPSVEPDVYRSITGGDLLNVVEGLEAACRLGIHIKINTVVMKGINDSSIDTIIDFARRHSSQLQLIELEDIHLDKGFFGKYHVDLSQTEQTLSDASEALIERDEMNRRRVYLVKGLQIEIVRPLNNPSFCAGCTRMRITSDGKIKPCLMRDDLLFDLLGGIRSGWTDEQLKDLFMYAVSAREPFYR